MSDKMINIDKNVFYIDFQRTEAHKNSFQSRFYSNFGPPRPRVIQGSIRVKELHKDFTEENHKMETGKQIVLFGKKSVFKSTILIKLLTDFCVTTVRPTVTVERNQNSSKVKVFFPSNASLQLLGSKVRSESQRCSRFQCQVR